MPFVILPLLRIILDKFKENFFFLLCFFLRKVYISRMIQFHAKGFDDAWMLYLAMSTPGHK